MELSPEKSDELFELGEKLSVSMRHLIFVMLDHADLDARDKLMTLAFALASVIDDLNPPKTDDLLWNEIKRVHDMMSKGD